MQFLPALSRLAFTFGDTFQVWGAKASKLLKSDTQLGDHPRLTRSLFSEGGCWAA